MTSLSPQPSSESTDVKWYRSRARSISGNAPQRSLPSMDNTAWIISSRLIAGLILYAALGWLLSLWLGHREIFMAIGALVGLGLSYYLIFTGLSRENKVLQEQAHSASKGTNMHTPASERDRA